LTLAHGAILSAAPSAATVGILFWFNANTLSHQHIHRRFFVAPAADAAFSAWLSLLLGIPQRLWCARHLAHHAGRPWRLRVHGALVAEAVLVAALWIPLAAAAPAIFFGSYLPGIALGLGLCWLHGHYEHHGGITSCYGRASNFLFQNDGYHVEHHAHPTVHPRDLRRDRDTHRVSPWPPVLRWLDATPALVNRALNALEHATLRAPWLRRAVLHVHRRALRRLADGLPAPRRVVIVGGGIFPRSALLALELWPDAEITVLDARASHLERARAWLPPRVRLVCARYEPGSPLCADVAFLPLALSGDRARAYAEPPAPACILHDWMWRARGEGVLVAWWLAKRARLVTQPRGRARQVLPLTPRPPHASIGTRSP
jgi:hypothetical protein